MHFCITGQYTPQALTAMMDNPATDRFAAFPSDVTNHFNARLLGRKLRFVPAQRLADHFARILVSPARYLPIHERRQVIGQANVSGRHVFFRSCCAVMSNLDIDGLFVKAERFAHA